MHTALEVIRHLLGNHYRITTPYILETATIGLFEMTNRGTLLYATEGVQEPYPPNLVLRVGLRQALNLDRKAFLEQFPHLTRTIIQQSVAE